MHLGQAMSFLIDTVDNTKQLQFSSSYTLLTLYFLVPSLEIWKEVRVKLKYMHTCKHHKIRVGRS